MIRVDQAECRVQPAAFRSGQQRQHAGEVSLVLVPRVLCLEQQHGLDSQVRDPVVGAPDDLVVRPADPPFVTAADPDVPIVRLPEEVEAPPGCRRIPGPGLMRVAGQGLGRQRRQNALARRHPELRLGKQRRQERKTRCGHGGLQVLVCAGLLPAEQIHRPAACDVPGDLQVAEALGQLSWVPCTQRSTAAATASSRMPRPSASS